MADFGDDDYYFRDDDTITEKDLDQIAAALEEADDLHHRYQFLSVPKIPCPECGGSGQIYGGSLGNICPSCGGARMVDHPGADKPSIPGFEAERRALGAYIRAQRTPNAVLPAASTLPRPEAMRERARRIKVASRQLASAPVVHGELAEPEKQAVGSLGDGEAEYTDEEIDAAIEADYAD